MTRNQHRMYWAEWRKCADALIGHGFGSDELDGHRHRIHLEACGRNVSSKSLTNAQLDAIIGAFRACSRPGDLREQMRIIHQPEKRLAQLRSRCQTLLKDIGIAAPGRSAYLDTLARRVCGRPWLALTDVEASRICGVLAAQAART